jgi:hypothetical protein
MKLPHGIVFPFLAYAIAVVITIPVLWLATGQPFNGKVFAIEAFLVILMSAAFASSWRRRQTP